MTLTENDFANTTSNLKLNSKVPNTDISVTKKLSKGQKKKLAAKRKKQREADKENALVNDALKGVDIENPEKYQAEKNYHKKWRNVTTAEKLLRQPYDGGLPPNAHQIGFSTTGLLDGLFGGGAKKGQRGSKSYVGPLSGMSDIFSKMTGLGGGPNRVNDSLSKVQDIQSWATAKELKKSQHEEWVLNIYRMRVDDDKYWGGNNHHGLYEIFFSDDPEIENNSVNQNKLIIIRDFLKFNILAVDNENLPENFNFKKYLALAKKFLPKIFKKKEAIIKYGKENIFEAEPSLRRQAEHVYRTAMMPDQNYGREKIFKLHELLEDKIQECINENEFEFSHYQIFDKVGGKELWVELFEGLDLSKLKGEKARLIRLSLK